MRDEREAARPARRVREAEPARDERAQSVGADDERRAIVIVAPSPVEHANAAHAPARIAHQIRDAHSLAHLGAGGARAVEQDRIEHRAPEREPAVAKGAEAVPRHEVAAQRRAVRRAHHHAR